VFCCRTEAYAGFKLQRELVDLLPNGRKNISGGQIFRATYEIFKILGRYQLLSSDGRLIKNYEFGELVER
jgi:hypothetical protein